MLEPRGRKARATSCPPPTDSEKNGSFCREVTRAHPVRSEGKSDVASSFDRLGAKRIILSRSDSCSSMAVGRCLAVKAGGMCPLPIGSEQKGSFCREVTCAQARRSGGASDVVSSFNRLGAKRITLSRSDLSSSLAVGSCLAVKAGATWCPPIGSEKNGSPCREVTCAGARRSEGECDVASSFNRLGEKRITLSRSDLSSSLEVGSRERRRVLLHSPQSKSDHPVEK